MKLLRILIVLWVVLFLLWATSYSAEVSEKEFLQMKGRALIAEANAIVLRIGEKNLIDLQGAQKAIEEFKKELDAKGFMGVDDKGNLVEKPKPISPGGGK